MTTLLGPHLLQRPTPAHIDILRRWQPPVALLLGHVRQQPWQADGLPLYPAPGESEGRRLTALVNLPLADLEAQLEDLRPHVRPFVTQPELRATRLVLRLFVADSRVQAQIAADPDLAARFHHRLVLAAHRQLGVLAARVQYWIIANEVLGYSRGALRLLARYERARLDRANDNYGCGLCGLANGNPPLYGQPHGGTALFDLPGSDPLALWRDPKGLGGLLEEVDRRNRQRTARHVLLLHQYFKPDAFMGDADAPASQDVWVQDDGWLTALNRRKHVGRLEHFLMPWLRLTCPHLRLIVSEYGADGRIGRTGQALRGSWGWKAFAAWRGPRNDGAPYLAALQALEAAARSSTDLILGYCLFGLGHNSTEFWSYHLEGESDHPDPQHRADLMTGLLAHVQALRDSPTPGPVPAADPDSEGASPRLFLRPTVTAGLHVRSGPGIHHPAVAILPGGDPTPHPLQARHPGPPVWWRIQLADGTVGWVHGAYVTVQGSLHTVPDIEEASA